MCSTARRCYRESTDILLSLIFPWVIGIAVVHEAGPTAQWKDFPEVLFKSSAEGQSLARLKSHRAEGGTATTQLSMER